MVQQFVKYCTTIIKKYCKLAATIVWDPDMSGAVSKCRYKSHCGTAVNAQNSFFFRQDFLHLTGITLAHCIFTAKVALNI
jgi:hypothetical protein